MRKPISTGTSTCLRILFCGLHTPLWSASNVSLTYWCSGRLKSQALNLVFILLSHVPEPALQLPLSAPGLGRSPGDGNGNPLQHSWLGNPMNRGA